MEHSDTFYVRAIRAGDRGALDALVRRWYPRIFGYVFRLLRHEQDSYDVTQEVFLSMMAALPRYHPWNKFDRWLFTIARNKCMDHFRRRRRELPLDQLARELSSQAPLPEDAAAASADVQAALGALPDSQRQAVLLHYFYQFTAKEIAQLTGAALPTVKSRLAAGKRALSQALQEESG